MNIELNDKRYIYIVEEDTGETYDDDFSWISMVTPDYDFAVSVLEKQRYKKDTSRRVLKNNSEKVTYFERTKKKRAPGWLPDSNGVTITRRKLTLPK